MLGDLPSHNTLLHVFSGGHEGLQTFGLDWCVQQTGSAPPAGKLHLVTDESKSYYYAHLQVADGSRLATASIVPAEDVLSIATRNLHALTLDLSEQSLPDGPLTVAVRSDLPLTLTLRGLRAGLCAGCEGDWASGTHDGGDLVLAIQPGAEARSLVLT
jgi:hypothetical protein